MKKQILSLLVALIALCGIAEQASAQKIFYYRQFKHSKVFPQATYNDVTKTVHFTADSIGAMGRFTINGHTPTISENTTRYFALNGPWGGSSVSTQDPTDPETGAEEMVWIPTYAGTMKLLYGRINVAPDTGETYIVTVMKNASATTLTMTFTHAGVTASDLTHSFTFSPGDRIAYRIAASSSAGSSGFKGSLSVGVELQAASANTGVRLYNQTVTGTVNGSNTAFTLATAPVSSTEAIHVNGVRQVPTTHYSVSGTTITFVTAPLVGSNIRVDFNPVQ